MSSGSAQRYNSRQGACIHCRQTGHSSNDCPSQASRPGSAWSREMNLQNGESSIRCDRCGTACTLQTANTANNRGRKFYSCRSQGCNFFVWEDELNGGRSAPHGYVSSSTSNPNRRGGRGGAHANDVTFVSATGEPVSGRRCFVCGDPSHFANVCPNRGM
ncbi:unnamed protein product [Ilex paraguariensis]|uniref:DNA topoisomerase 3-alpha n=1 Tax=Ilex paraguariensis TaxID=185542 RepID=A0ABC8TCX6_9AQUA